MRLPVVDVAVAIVRAADGRVLLAERTARQLAAGFWELPGGKIDSGESAVQAAARELEEEVGIHATKLRPWIAYEHAFRTRRIRLQFFRVDAWSGEPRGREGQRVAWVDPAASHVAPLLPSNERVLHALGLPPLVAVVHCTSSAYIGRLQTLLAAGLRLVVVREPHLTPDQRVALARRVQTLAHAYGAKVLLAGTALEARRAGVIGMHTAAHELARLTARPPVGLWSASCHNAADLEHAVALGADVAVLSPVLPCGSQSGRPPLGWDGLQSLAAGSPIPIYAQGGMDPSRLAQARQAGAIGVVTQGA